MCSWFYELSPKNEFSSLVIIFLRLGNFSPCNLKLSINNNVDIVRSIALLVDLRISLELLRDKRVQAFPEIVLGNMFQEGQTFDDL